MTERGLLRILLNPAITGQAVTPGQALAILAGTEPTYGRVLSRR